MSHPFDYPGLKELATHLAEVLAMQEGDGWHTFRMDIKTTPDGQTLWVDNISLTEIKPSQQPTVCSACGGEPIGFCPDYGHN